MACSPEGKNGFESTGSRWLEIVSEEDLAWWNEIEELLVPDSADGIRDLYVRYAEACWRRGATYVCMEEFLWSVIKRGLDEHAMRIEPVELKIRRDLHNHLEKASHHG
jgi:hypothetical protein